MNDKPNIHPFNQDATEHGGYLYTTKVSLSSLLATQRTTDTILQLGHFAGRSVIDMGCGDGFFTLRFWDVGHPTRMTGVDMADKAIEVANKRRGDRPIYFEVGDAHKLPYPDNSFDLAVIQSILHHDDNPLATIREAFRLAPEVLIHEPNGNNFGLKVIEKTSAYHREHGERSYTARRIMSWIEQAGGRAVTWRYSGFVPMFCPDWIARNMKRLEGIVEQTPFLNIFGCAVYVVVAVRR
jgi:SAM-dependent methyltransferase